MAKPNLDTIMKGCSGSEEDAIRYIEENIAMTDPLTGLYNRNFFDITLNNALADIKREYKDISLLMIDFDNFKGFNTTYGHVGGDEVLRIVGNVIKNRARGSDIPARYRGDELAIILPNTELQMALSVAYELNQKVPKRPIELYNKNTGFKDEVRATITLGVSQALEEDSCESLIARADRYLYNAKEDGDRNCVFGPGGLYVSSP